jgi:hypothetical protein
MGPALNPGIRCRIGIRSPHTSTVDFGNAGGINHRQRGKSEQRERGAYHGGDPDCRSRTIDRLSNVVISKRSDWLLPLNQRSPRLPSIVREYFCWSANLRGASGDAPANQFAQLCSFTLGADKRANSRIQQMSGFAGVRKIEDGMMR